MSVLSGFFNAVGGDRTYDAEDFASMFDGLILDGIFAGYGDAFTPTRVSNTSVTIGVGRAWFNHTYTYNDTVLALTIGEASALARIDSVVLKVDKSQAVRTNSIYVKAGTPGATPVAPTLESSTYIHEYRVCNVNVPASGDTTIEDTRGTSECPYVSRQTLGWSYREITIPTTGWGAMSGQKYYLVPLSGCTSDAILIVSPFTNEVNDASYSTWCDINARAGGCANNSFYLMADVIPSSSFKITTLLISPNA